jgi:hypothetical protein
MSDLYPEDELRRLLRNPTRPFGTEDQLSRAVIFRIHIERRRRVMSLGILAACANFVAAILVVVALLKLAPRIPEIWENTRPALEGVIDWTVGIISAAAPIGAECAGHFAPWLIPGFLLILAVEFGGIWILKTHWHRL